MDRTALEESEMSEVTGPQNLKSIEHDGAFSNRRREFLMSTAVAGMTALTTQLPGAYAAERSRLRVGLIGCGGRGTGAAAQALNADPDVELFAMGDAFEDRLEKSLANLNAEPVADRVKVPQERRFVGFDAYRQVIDSGVDVVLLTTPPHFRPIHLRAAIEAGKHVFAEKPVAVDAPGVRSVLETCRLAKSKQLAVVSGLCLRYHAGFQETVQRIHDGQIGELVHLEANDYRGPIWTREREPDWTDMHWQMRNWYYYTWLSGDFNVEQHVHYLDVCAWLKGAYPTRAVGMGGREVRKGDQFGNIFDHHSVTYYFEDGSRLVSNTRQQSNCYREMSAYAFGTQGVAEVSERRLEIERPERWRFRGKPRNMYQVEHDLLFRSIRQGKPINNGEYMCQSTLLAIMGRMATYTGQEVTWKQAESSTESLGPKRYEWGAAPEAPIAVPGVTELV